VKKIEYKKDWKEIEFSSVVDLYNSVGWIAYTNKPSELQRAFKNSSYTRVALVNSKAVGLIRTLSDSVSIHYIQDIEEEG
jgi:hypothetical protein